MAIGRRPQNIPRTSYFDVETIEELNSIHARIIEILNSRGGKVISYDTEIAAYGLPSVNYNPGEEPVTLHRWKGMFDGPDSSTERIRMYDTEGLKIIVRGIAQLQESIRGYLFLDLNLSHEEGSTNENEVFMLGCRNNGLENWGVEPNPVLN